MPASQILVTHGTCLTWIEAGGDKKFTLSGLANGGGRSGDEHDFGASFPPRLYVQLDCTFTAAPEAGSTMDVYWSNSIDGVNYMGEVATSDVAYNDENDMKRLDFIGTLVTTKDINPQRQGWTMFLPTRYGIPVVNNQSGQTLTNAGSANFLTVTPVIDEIQN